MVKDYGCEDKCVDKMKEEGMLDDPGYVTYECNCSPVEVYNEVEVDNVPELKPKEMPAA